MQNTKPRKHKIPNSNPKQPEIKIKHQNTNHKTTTKQENSRKLLTPHKPACTNQTITTTRINKQSNHDNTNSKTTN